MLLNFTDEEKWSIELKNLPKVTQSIEGPGMKRQQSGRGGAPQQESNHSTTWYKNNSNRDLYVYAELTVFAHEIIFTPKP